MAAQHGRALADVDPAALARASVAGAARKLARDLGVAVDSERLGAPE